MKGAGKYYYPFYYCYKELGLEKIGREGYFINNIYFQFGEHARGKELFIYIVKDKNDLVKNGIYKCDSLKVYGVVSGNPGWTEEYGWIIEGKWVPICKEIMEKSILLNEERKVNLDELKKKAEERNKISLRNKAKDFESYIK